MDKRHRIGEYHMMYIYLSIIGIFISESMIFFGSTGYGLGVHVINAIAIIFMIIFSDSMKVKYALQSIMLVVLLRIINLSVPQFFVNDVLQYVLIYGIFIVPIYYVIKQASFKEFMETYLNTKNSVIYIPIGIAMAIIGYKLQDPTAKNPLVSILENLDKINIPDAAFIGIAMFMFVIVVEEVIFRGILQTSLQKAFGLKRGLLFSSLIFGMMHSIYRIPGEILFAVMFGIVVGYIFQKTRNFPLIALIHGSIITLSSVLHIDTNMSVVVINSKEILDIGGGFVTIFLIFSLLVSLLLANTKYWKRLVPETLNMCTKTLLSVFIIVMIFKIMLVINKT